MNIYVQYYVLNAWFNFCRALYISTFSLYIIEILRIPVSWTIWLLVADLAFSTLAELPTGAFADTHGRKTSFVVGCSISTLGYIVYGIASALPSLHGAFIYCIAAEIMLAIGLGFYSGALDAWIVDHPDKDPNLSLQRLFSRAQAIKNVFYVIGGILGVIIFAYLSMTRINTFLVAGCISAALTVIAGIMMKPDSQDYTLHNYTGFVSSLQKIVEQISKTTHSAFSDKRVSTLITCTCTSVLLLQILVVYWPYYLTLLPQSEIHSRSLYVSLSIAWVAAYGSRAIGNSLADTPLARRHPLAVMAVSVLLNSLSILILTLLPPLLSDSSNSFLLGVPVALYALIRGSEGTGDTLRQTFLNSIIENHDRTTMLSVVRSAALFGTFVALVCLGAVLSTIGLLFTLAILACANILTLILYPRLMHLELA